MVLREKRGKGRPFVYGHGETVEELVVKRGRKKGREGIAHRGEGKNEEVPSSSGCLRRCSKEEEEGEKKPTKKGEKENQPPQGTLLLALRGRGGKEKGKKDAMLRRGKTLSCLPNQEFLTFQKKKGEKGSERNQGKGGERKEDDCLSHLFPREIEEKRRERKEIPRKEKEVSVLFPTKKKKTVHLLSGEKREREENDLRRCKREGRKEEKDSHPLGSDVRKEGLTPLRARKRRGGGGCQEEAPGWRGKGGQDFTVGSKKRRIVCSGGKRGGEKDDSKEKKGKKEKRSSTGFSGEKK